MGMNNDSLVNLVAARPEYLDSTPRSQQVLEAMRKVDRKNFIPDEEETLTIISAEAHQQLKQSLGIFNNGKTAVWEDVRKIVQGACAVNASAWPLKVSRRDLAYQDEVIPIGYDQTCSQPSMVAFMADALKLQPGMKVLEIGTGCGYHAAVTAELVGKKGKVYSLEYISELAELAHNNLKRHFGAGYQQRVFIIEGDGSAGLPEKAPFDAIYLTAGVRLNQFEPGILAAQLKLPGGTLLYPERDGLMMKEVYGPFGNIQDIKFYSEVCFVPLKEGNTTPKKELPIVWAP